MRVRRLASLFWALIMAACCFALYFFTDKVLKTPMRSSVHEEMQDNKWLHFEDRLKQLESELSQHHAVVGEIRSAVKQLLPPAAAAAGGAEALRGPPPQQPLNPFKTAAPARSAQPKCAMRMDSVPNTHIQMLSVYEKLKFDNPDGGPWKQGWRIEYDPQQWNPHHKLKVFIVPHSHNDPGWLKTFEEYYTSQTSSILNNVLQKLTENPRYRFIWAEMSFFAMWWEDISEEQKRQAKKLLQSGQLEIVTGGWVMNDEANSHWISIAQQLTTGHQWIKKNLGVLPRSGWAIDPFGHSPSQPYLLKLAGLDSSLIQRTHYSVKKELASMKQLEFRWRQMWDGSGKTDMFTHMMPFYSYDVPHSCGPDPKVCCQFDFKRLPGYGLSCPWKIPPQVITDRNVNHKAELLLDQWRKKSQLYKSRVLLVPLGDDFRWDHATEWDAQFNNYERILDYINANENLHTEVKFGTLSDFFRALKAESSQEEFPVLSGDFFTYADRDDHYWSGYYTSRPYYKRMDRVLMAYIRAAEMILALARSRVDVPQALLTPEAGLSPLLAAARKSLALFQHHDGVTGTSRDLVVVDYGNKLLQAISNSQYVIQQCAYHLLVQPEYFRAARDQVYFEVDDMRRGHSSLPEKLTITVGPEAPSRKVVFFNSLPFTREEVVSLHVSTPYITVVDTDGVPVNCQISPVFISEATVSHSKFLLNFVASVPGLGLSSYVVTAVEESSIYESTTFSSVRVLNYDGVVTLNSAFKPAEVLSVSRGGEFSVRSGRGSSSGGGAAFSRAGLLKAIKDRQGHTIPVHLDFIQYGTRQTGDRSGGYLFLPGTDGIIVKNDNPSPIITIIEGAIIARMQVQLPHVQHTVSLYSSSGADSLGLEVMNLVDVSSAHNLELAMRLSTSINNNDRFYTDLNGLQMIRRKRFPKLPLQANFYPLPAAAYIEDEKLRLTLLTSTSLGVAALQPGQIEVMQDRRLNQDDNRGMAQGVLDNHPTQHIFRIILESRADQKCRGAAEDHPSGQLSLSGHVSSQTLLNPFIPLFYSGDGGPERAGPEEPQGTNLHAGFSPMVVEAGVDINIASYRDDVLATPKGAKTKNGRGIVLHRQQLDICFNSEDLLKQFPVSDGQIKISDLVPVSEIDEMNNASLSFLYLGASVDPATTLSLCPMEISSFFIYR